MQQNGGLNASYQQPVQQPVQPLQQQQQEFAQQQPQQQDVPAPFFENEDRQQVQEQFHQQRESQSLQAEVDTEAQDQPLDAFFEDARVLDSEVVQRQNQDLHRKRSTLNGLFIESSKVKSHFETVSERAKTWKIHVDHKNCREESDDEIRDTFGLNDFEKKATELSQDPISEYTQSPDKSQRLNKNSFAAVAGKNDGQTRPPPKTFSVNFNLAGDVPREQDLQIQEEPPQQHQQEQEHQQQEQEVRVEEPKPQEQHRNKESTPKCNLVPDYPESQLSQVVEPTEKFVQQQDVVKPVVTPKPIIKSAAKEFAIVREQFGDFDDKLATNFEILISNLKISFWFLFLVNFFFFLKAKQHHFDKFVQGWR